MRCATFLTVASSFSLRTSARASSNLEATCASAFAAASCAICMCLCIDALNSLANCSLLASASASADVVGMNSSATTGNSSHGGIPCTHVTGLVIFFTHAVRRHIPLFAVPHALFSPMMFFFGSSGAGHDLLIHWPYINHFPLFVLICITQSARMLIALLPPSSAPSHTCRTLLVTGSLNMAFTSAPG